MAEAFTALLFPSVEHRVLVGGLSLQHCCDRVIPHNVASLIRCVTPRDPLLPQIRNLDSGGGHAAITWLAFGSRGTPPMFPLPLVAAIDVAAVGLEGAAGVDVASAAATFAGGAGVAAGAADNVLLSI